MLSKKNVPDLTNLVITDRVEGNQRYIQANHDNKKYEVRVPLHIWNLCQQGDSDAAWHMEPYVRKLMANIARGRSVELS